MEISFEKWNGISLPHRCVRAFVELTIAIKLFKNKFLLRRIGTLACLQITTNYDFQLTRVL